MGLGTSKTDSITIKELELVNESWKVVMENAEENGVLIFKTFLDKYNYYGKFNKFKNIPLEELPNSSVFRNHASAILQALNKIIVDLNDTTSVKNQLMKLASFHARNKITEKEFQELKEIILDVLENHFKLPQEATIAWNKILDIGFHYIFEGLKFS